jgi:hypothetical protein
MDGLMNINRIPQSVPLVINLLRTAALLTTAMLFLAAFIR